MGASSSKKGNSTDAPVSSSKRSGGGVTGGGVAGQHAGGGLGNSGDKTNVADGIPTVIRWAGGAATSVRLLGPFTVGQQHQQNMVSAVGGGSYRPSTTAAGGGIPLNKSGEDFFLILNLPKGEHEYKFLVDGKEAIDTTQATISSSAHGMCNIINVNDDSILGSRDLDDPMHLFGRAQANTDEGYGQVEQVFEDKEISSIMPSTSSVHSTEFISTKTLFWGYYYFEQWRWWCF